METTHNLEVPGSSPGWSTNPKRLNPKELEKSDSLFFCPKNGLREPVGNLKVISKSNKIRHYRVK